MSDLRLLMTIVRRKQGEEYLDFFRKNDVPFVLSMLCEGTATPSLLEMMGLVQRERVMLWLIAPAQQANRLLKRLVSQMHIDVPNAGIALSVPLNSDYENMLSEAGCDPESATEVKEMDAYPYSLITAIAEKGYSNVVMDAARAAGARGGTIMHAKGSGANLASRFFGISIAEEREMILITVRSEDRAKIMQAINEKAGKSTAAQAVVFSMPVEAAAGLNLIQEDEE